VAITVRAGTASGFASTANSSFQVTFPTTPVDGELMFIWCYTRDASSADFAGGGAPSGWTRIGSGTSAYGTWAIFARIWHTGDSTANVTVTTTISTNETAGGRMFAVAGADVSGTAAQAFDVNPTAQTFAASGSTPQTYTHTGISVLTADSAVFLFGGKMDGTNSTAQWSGWAAGYATEIADNNTATGNDMGYGGAWGLKASSGATGNLTATAATAPLGGADAGATLVAFAIKPPTAPLTGELLVSGAQATCTGGPVALQAVGPPLNASGAAATGTTGGTTLSASVPVTGATAAATTGGTFVSEPGNSEPIIGSVTEPTSTTWECVISNITVETTFDVASSDGQSTSITVAVPAVAHTVRIEAGGAPITATLDPGADASGADATGRTGSVALAGSKPVTGAQATGATGSTSRTASVPVTGATASATTGGTVVLSSTQTHRIRIEAGGTPVEFDLVPGQDASGALATGTGAIALAAELPVTGAQATGATGSVRIVEHLMVSGAQATGATGSVALAGSRSVTGATATGRTGSVRIESNWGPPSPSIPWLPYNPGLGTLPRGWWKRRGRVW
jgi:hypothetical protein